MDTHEAMVDVWANFTNKELAEMTETNYYTVSSWKYQFRHNQLSLEKQIQILSKLNYQIKSHAAGFASRKDRTTQANRWFEIVHAVVNLASLIFRVSSKMVKVRASGLLRAGKIILPPASRRPLNSVLIVSSNTKMTSFMN